MGAGETIVWVAAILLYGVVLARFIPKGWHFVTNVTVVVLSVWLAWLTGLSFKDMGLGISFIWQGIAVAVLVSIVIMIALFVTAHISPVNKYLLSQESILRQTSSRIAFETAVRIPLSTALMEEVLFRGILLGILLQHYESLASIAVAAMVFGIWHILPASERAKEGQVAITTKSQVVGTILATGIAGAFFCWLRLLAGSIIAPWLVHWTINSSAMLATLFAEKQQRRKEGLAG